MPDVPNRFDKGLSVTSPTFRRFLNETAAQAAQASGSAVGPMQAGFSGDGTESTQAGPIRVKLFEVPAGNTWGKNTTDGIQDDVNSAICQEVYLNQRTNVYEVNTEYEYRVYNATLGGEPGEGQRFYARLNPQSGRYEVESSGGVTPGVIQCYLGKGWYNVELRLAPDVPSDCETCVPSCEEESCRWVWDEDNASWSKLSDSCNDGCACVEPGTSGTYNGQTCTTRCTSESPDCSAQATYTWYDDSREAPLPRNEWVLTTACGNGCESCPPEADGTTDLETQDVDCQSVDCDAFTDPADLCCPLDLCPPECPDPPRAAFNEADGVIVKAFQLNGFTIPAGNRVFVQPMAGGNWGIVSYEDELLCLQIPTQIECCDDGTIRFTQYARAIVRGLSCSAFDDPCPTEAAPSSGFDSGFSAAFGGSTDTDGFSAGFDSGFGV